LRKSAIRAFYRISKLVGLFHVARLLTRRKLRILCYHGFVLEDEDQFRSSLFMRPDAFEDRMRSLRNKKFPILSFDEALSRLRADTLPPNSVTITIDDGFYSAYAVALDVLRKYDVPATLYLTSYYFLKGTPIFELVVNYMCWKSANDTVDLSGLGIPGFDQTPNHDFNPHNRQAICEDLLAYGTSALDEPGRIALCCGIADRMGVDYGRIVESRILSLVSPDELVAMQRAGVSVGLHTHRHHFPRDRDLARSEIEDNRAAVEPVIGETLVDFCYPMGEWSTTHWPILKDNGVKSATTGDSGLADRDTARFGLPRILDSNQVAAIEWEAEIFGFTEILRRLRFQRPPRARAADSLD